jgi:glutamate-1-semialdehyde 2,1-aminomutase
MEVLAFRRGPGVKVKHPGTHNAHPVSAAAGVAMLDLVADGSAQSRADETAQWLRQELSAAFERTGARGYVQGQSSTFRVMVGMEPTADPVVLKRGMPPDVLEAVQAGMLLEGVHLFQGRGFVSTAHTDTDVERTAAAFERTLRRLRQEGLA